MSEVALAVREESLPSRAHGNTLPTPTGYRMLVQLPEKQEKTQGGLYMPEQAKHIEQVASIWGTVLVMGEDCYKDKDRFENGPWCKVGDHIMFRPYSGTRFKWNGVEYRILNDDSVEAVVEDPSLLERV